MFALFLLIQLPQVLVFACNRPLPFKRSALLYHPSTIRAPNGKSVWRLSIVGACKPGLWSDPSYSSESVIQEPLGKNIAAIRSSIHMVAGPGSC